MRGNFSSYICLSLKNRFVCPLHLNADNYKIIFWFRVVIFVIMSIKFASVKKFTFPPTPKSLFSKIMCDRRSSCAADMMADLPILHFCNPWHNSFLEKISFALFYRFMCLQQQYIFGYVYKIKFNKTKTYLFQCHVAHYLHQNAWLQPDSYESWENLL